MSGLENGVKCDGIGNSATIRVSRKGKKKKKKKRKKERKKTVLEVQSTRTCLGKLKDVCRCTKEKAEVKPRSARRRFVASDPTAPRDDKDE